MRAFWLLIHLLSAIVWIGGMAFAVGCLRPAVAALAPEDRQALMTRVLSRFLDWVALAVVGLWASGLGLFASTPIEMVPLSWWVMVAVAVVMTVVFCVLKLRRLPALLRARKAGDRAAAAGILAGMHRLVLANLGLGLFAVAQIKLY